MEKISNQLTNLSQLILGRKHNKETIANVMNTKAISFNTTIEKQLSHIVGTLLLNGTLTECPGLVHGKMGIAIFFFHYTQYTKNMLFADYALDLIGEIQNQIHVNSPADYEKGIAGIGIGIDYLIRNNFLIVEDDIFEDLDQRMYRAVMYDPWQDFSLYDGLTGYGRYWISRLRYQKPSTQARECLWHIVELIKGKLSEVLPEERTGIYSFLLDLQEISGYENCGSLLEQYKKWDVNKNFHCLGNSTVGYIAHKIQTSRYFHKTSQDEIDNILKQLPNLDMEKPPATMGLLSGYAGEGLLRLTALNSTDLSWMQLL